MLTNIEQLNAMSDPAILAELGHFIKQNRLKLNKTQQDVADEAGIDRTTLVKIEKGIGGTLLTFIQILRAIKQLEILENFKVKQELSPLKLAELEMKKKRRASRNTSRNNKQTSTW